MYHTNPVASITFFECVSVWYTRFFFAFVPAYAYATSLKAKGRTHDKGTKAPAAKKRSVGAPANFSTKASFSIETVDL